MIAAADTAVVAGWQAAVCLVAILGAAVVIAVRNWRRPK